MIFHCLKRFPVIFKEKEVNKYFWKYNEWKCIMSLWLWKNFDFKVIAVNERSGHLWMKRMRMKKPFLSLTQIGKFFNLNRSLFSHSLSHLSLSFLSPMLPKRWPGNWVSHFASLSFVTLRLWLSLSFNSFHPSRLPLFAFSLSPSSSSLPLSLSPTNARNLTDFSLSLALAFVT